MSFQSAFEFMKKRGNDKIIPHSLEEALIHEVTR